MIINTAIVLFDKYGIKKTFGILVLFFIFLLCLRLMPIETHLPKYDKEAFSMFENLSSTFVCVLFSIVFFENYKKKIIFSILSLTILIQIVGCIVLEFFCIFSFIVIIKKILRDITPMMKMYLYLIPIFLFMIFLPYVSFKNIYDFRKPCMLSKPFKPFDREVYFYEIQPINDSKEKLNLIINELAKYDNRKFCFLEDRMRVSSFRRSSSISRDDLIYYSGEDVNRLEIEKKDGLIISMDYSKTPYEFHLMKCYYSVNQTTIVYDAKEITIELLLYFYKNEFQRIFDQTNSFKIFNNTCTECFVIDNNKEMNFKISIKTSEKDVR